MPQVVKRLAGPRESRRAGTGTSRVPSDNNKKKGKNNRKAEAAKARQERNAGYSSRFGDRSRKMGLVLWTSCTNTWISISLAPGW